MIGSNWQPTGSTMAAIENSAIFTVCALLPAKSTGQRAHRLLTLYKLQNIFKVLRKDADKIIQED
jgi:hypothetical protein